MMYLVTSVLLEILNSFRIGLKLKFKFLLALNAILNILIFYYINGPLLQNFYTVFYMLMEIIYIYKLNAL